MEDRQMTLRKYIGLFLGRVPVYTYQENTAKYGGHMLFYIAIVAAASAAAHAFQPLGFAGRILAFIVMAGAVIGLMRSMLCIKQTVD
jgi:hypothetical protein